MGAMPELNNDIRKFEQIGTHPASHKLAITEAVNFHESIGAERKAARFRYLRRRWSDRLRQHPKVRILNSDDPAQACAIGFVSVEGMSAVHLSEQLWAKERILASAIVTPGEYEGLRVMPNVYTTLEEIDTFAEAMERLIG